MLRLCREELFFFGLDNVNGLRSHTVLTYPPAEVTAGLPCPWVYDKIDRKNARKPAGKVRADDPKSLLLTAFGQERTKEE